MLGFSAAPVRAECAACKANVKHAAALLAQTCSGAVQAGAATIAAMSARVLVLVFAGALLVVGCGSSERTAPRVTSPTTTRPAAPSVQTRGTTPSALQPEANSTATGDIPDNQVFISFMDTTAAYSMKYPEGWAQQGAGMRVIFRDKNNIVRVVVTPGAAPTAASVRADLRRLAGAQVRSGPQRLTISGERAFKVVYTTASAPNAVTGKRVTLQVDRYYLSRAGKEAIVDLGTPVGVDNVDAYRLMIESFRWR
jgi:hypothetical protein